MVSRALCLLFVIFGCVFSEEGSSLLHPCNVEDMECLSHSTEKFLENTCRGIPAYDIRPIDPMIISALDYAVDEDLGVIFYFKNLNITGLKNLKISHFNMDTSLKTVILTTRVDANVVGEVTTEFKKQAKLFPGTFTAKASSLVTASYNYSLVKKDNGVEYFEVGPETITCAGLGEPEITASSDQAIKNDPVAKEVIEKYHARRAELRHKTFCKIIKEAYSTVVHNIRASAKILPKTAFFNNV